MAEQSNKKNNFSLDRILDCLVSYILVPIFPSLALPKQEKSRRETAYQLAAEHLHFQPSDPNKTDNNLFENYLKTFGLLPEKGYIKWRNCLQGEKNGVPFSLQDTSWMLNKDQKLPSLTYHAKAHYALLTLSPYHSIHSNVLIKNKKIFNGSIRLKQVEIEDDEFESLYDIYSDNSAEAIMLLRTGFSQALLNYIQTTKKQAEFIITSQKIFVLFPYSPGMGGRLHSSSCWDRPLFEPFTAPDSHQIEQDISDILEIIPALSLLENPRA